MKRWSLASVYNRHPFKLPPFKSMEGQNLWLNLQVPAKILNLNSLCCHPLNPNITTALNAATAPFVKNFTIYLTLLEDSVRGMQAALTKAVHKYNTYRLHKNFNKLTPMAYIKNTLSETSILSQSFMNLYNFDKHLDFFLYFL